jgi:hypothetical protein
MKLGDLSYSSMYSQLLPLMTVVVHFTLRMHYPSGKNLRYSRNKQLCGSEITVEAWQAANDGATKSHCHYKLD